MKEMRERIVKIIDNYAKEELPSVSLFSQACADELINAGCVLPKFNVGQKVWFDCSRREIESGSIGEIIILEQEIKYSIQSLTNGKLKKTTREESELYITKDEALNAVKSAKA